MGPLPLFRARVWDDAFIWTTCMQPSRVQVTPNAALALPPSPTRAKGRDEVSNGRVKRLGAPAPAPLSHRATQASSRCQSNTPTSSSPAANFSRSPPAPPLHRTIQSSGRGSISAPTSNRPPSLQTVPATIGDTEAVGASTGRKTPRSSRNQASSPARGTPLGGGAAASRTAAGQTSQRSTFRRDQPYSHPKNTGSQVKTGVRRLTSASAAGTSAAIAARREVINQSGEPRETTMIVRHSGSTDA